MKQKHKGFTLVEIFITLIIVGLIVGFVLTSFHDNVTNQRLKNAAESIFADLKLAKSEASKRNQTVYVSFASNGSSWCYGLSEGSPCDCNINNFCSLDHVDKVRSSQSFKNVQLQYAQFAGKSSYTAFDPGKGFAIGKGVKNGTIWLKATNGSQIAIILNRVGRVRMCSPTLPGYPRKCPKNPNPS